jgi:long-chain acyl-CoA synthetase
MPQDRPARGPADPADRADRPVNVADLVRRAAARAGRRTALIAGSERPTWSELDASVDALAAGLARAGLTAGDRVGIACGTGLAFARTWWAALRAGLVAVPLNPSYTARELAHQVSDSGCRLVVCDTDLPDAFATAERVVVVGGPDWADLTSAPGPDGTGTGAGTGAGTGTPALSDRGGEDLAALVYTSGTSGRPRGAMLTHRALLANLEQLGAVDPAVVGPDDVVLLALPLIHIYGLNTGLNLTAAFGATAVLLARFDPVESLATIVRESVTTIIGAPPMYVTWSLLPDAAASFATVRMATSGSAPLPPDVLDRMHRATGLTVYEGYGLTEASPVLTLSRPDAGAKPGSVGRALPGVEIRLVDGSGRDVEPVAGTGGTGSTGSTGSTGDTVEDDDDPPDAWGEVVVRGENLFSGYWPDGAGGPDPDGWFATGDVAFRDDDGDLHLVDRRSDLILVSGFNVYPREVEDVLRTHPAVADVAVLGAPHPYTGETVTALVVPVDGTAPGQAELIAHAARSLARFKLPTAITLVESLPHSVTGKVSRGRLREGR